MARDAAVALIVIDRPGRHVVQLDREGRLPTGLYLLRLTQGTSRVTGRATILK